ncbi:MAG: hypothetical protein RMJ00_01110 [Nitrososphaerota archaeon]|nr:hypothetical protein [Candidatus Bathyarchaeota archaeon]MCX8161874.1 hypothetical protein [Candidatus Bathyarchaeota archaeon]MDW8061286.1 hypothetical protein [Nitrososphaerota archaeon]
MKSIMYALDDLQIRLYDLREDIVSRTVELAIMETLPSTMPHM